MAAVRPLIATPCHWPVLCLNYVTSILRLRAVFWQLGIEHEFCLRSGESAITRARNDIVQYFRDGDWTHLFWIDSDIGFRPAAAVRLLTAGLAVVAGVYPLKCEAGGFPLDAEAMQATAIPGFYTVDAAPAGFMCIARDVFDHMAAAGIGPHEFFDNMRVGDEYLTEDYAFCRRWRNCGGLIHVVPELPLTHQGTKLFTGTITGAA